MSHRSIIIEDVITVFLKYRRIKQGGISHSARLQVGGNPLVGKEHLRIDVGEFILRNHTSPASAAKGEDEQESE